MPRKVLVDLAGRPMIAQLARRMKAVKGADAVVIAAPLHDVEIISKAVPTTPIYGGPEQDLLTRLIGCADEYEADVLVRVTADCPLLPPEMVSHGIEVLVQNADMPLCQNWRPRTYPDGFDFDIWRVDFLEKLSAQLRDLRDREYFAQYCLDRELNNSSIQNSTNLSHMRLTVDHPADLELVRKIYDDQGDDIWDAERIVRWMASHPADAQLNQKHNDGTYGARKA
jgi:spore coat polysaccharide biosynthesis protein SpsF